MLNYQDCCQLLHNNSQFASNAEQLMRSRYCAYALKNADYIYQTYETSSRAKQSKEEIEAWAKNTHWVKLEVIDHQNDIDFPTVHFRASYLEKSKLFQLEEVSRFDPNEHFYYIDGEIVAHQQVATIKRNDNCPCDSGKKFKKCCQLKAN